MTQRSTICLVAVAVAVAGCTVGPDYQRPDAPTPLAFKEAAGWKPSEPRDWQSRGPWWSVYGDPVLDDLERQVDVSNQNLKAAEAAFRQASATIDVARAGFYPTVTTGGSAQRLGSGSQATSSGGRSASGRKETLYDVSVSAAWVPDLWGRIRRTVEGDTALAEVSAADLASARLSAQSALAVAYMQLRSDDELKRLLEAAVVAYTGSVEITRNRYDAGIAAQSDVVQAEAQLETTRAQAVGVGVQRAQLEHAIAVLTGRPPSEFTIAPEPFRVVVPTVPVEMPSALLERRPDIAAAERQMAAANAQIGVAEAAFYPDLTLTASYGYAGLSLGNLISAPHSLWSVGAAVAATLFDAGGRSAQVTANRAAYDQTVAGYRQTVLASFQQVEDQLAALRILEEQARVEEGAVRAAREAERLVLNQYRAGTQAYTSVLTAQTTALTNEQAALVIAQNRLVASVTLIQALGGGWTASQATLADKEPSPSRTAESARADSDGPRPTAKAD